MNLIPIAPPAAPPGLAPLRPIPPLASAAPGPIAGGYQPDQLAIGAAPVAVDKPASGWLGPKARAAFTRIDPRNWFGHQKTINIPGITYNQAEFIQDRQVFAEKYRMIDGAQRSIQLETFIIHNDETSRNMAYRLALKAAEGVDVKFLYDPNGSTGSDQVIRYMREHGIQVLPSVKPQLIPGDVDHRKMLIVDGRAAMTGGMNIGDEYANRWHDTMVKVQGPVVSEMQRKFFEVWRSAGGKGDETPFLAPPDAVPQGAVATQVFSTGPGDISYKKTLFDVVARAKKYILIAVPYWGDPEFINQVIAARRRGVDVKVVVPNTSDLFGKLNYPTRPFLQTMIDNGIDVYSYQVDKGKDNYNHGKVIVVDGQWASVGSGNLDFRSFHTNYELNLAFHDAAFARDVEQKLFLPDLQNSEHLTEAPRVNILVKGLDWVVKKFYHLI